MLRWEGEPRGSPSPVRIYFTTYFKDAQVPRRETAAQGRVFRAAGLMKPRRARRLLILRKKSKKDVDSGEELMYNNQR